MRKEHTGERVDLLPKDRWDTSPNTLRRLSDGTWELWNKSDYIRALDEFESNFVESTFQHWRPK